ncbi:MAG: hypothetical protein GX075_13705, partial [Firmicutes bacterium]|nr:hypothetical protein [Bacillota bacterium]
HSLVERRFEKNPNDPDSANAKLARLRRLNSGNETVLASKPQDVTAKIEEILGINCKEFSRAVVLPQGKFDKFLTMTGGDRAAMLEHLFNLEQYGEGLVARVKNEISLLATQLERIEGEEQGLGDCSKAALEQAIVWLKAKHDEYSAARQALEAAEKSYQEVAAVRDLYLKRKTAMEKLEQLEQDRETVAEMESRLDAAERAEPLRELIARGKELQQKIKVASSEYQSKLNVYSEAVKNHKEAGEALACAEKDYNEQLPLLQERKAKYREAREKLTKIKVFQKDTGDKRQELGALREKITGVLQEIEVCKKRMTATQAELDGLRRERAGLTADPEEKEAVEKALAVLTRLEDLEARYRESKDVYSDRKARNDGRWSMIAAKVREMVPDKEVSAGEPLEKYTKPLLEAAEKDLEEARKAYQQALIANAAAELVKELHDGEPCPVCGSREHPAPARAGGVLEESERTVKATEQRLRRLREWEEELLKDWHDWSINESLVKEARELTEKHQQDLQAVAAEFEKVRGKYEREQLRIRKGELTDFEKRIRALEGRQEELVKTQQDLTGELEKLNNLSRDHQIAEASVGEALKGLQAQLENITAELNQITDGKDLEDLIRDLVQTHERLQKAVESAKGKEAETRAAMEALARETAALEATLKANEKELNDVKQRLAKGLEESGFSELAQAEAALLPAMERQGLRKELENYRNALAIAEDELEKLEREINGRPFDEALFKQAELKRQELTDTVEGLKEEVTLAKNRGEELREKQERWTELQKQKAAAEQRKNLAEDLANLLRGRKFVSFLAQEHLRDMTLEASYQLGRLTGQRYALELAKDKDCEFVIRDDYNGGNRRLINSLSGGEIFLTSLALALALSSKIQLRGKYPLGFFFLDEGFGSLDQEKLDKVMNALEKLHNPNRMVGVISHLREIKERLPKYLEVLPAGEDGSGSRIKA